MRLFESLTARSGPISKPHHHFVIVYSFAERLKTLRWRTLNSHSLRCAVHTPASPCAIRTTSFRGPSIEHVNSFERLALRGLEAPQSTGADPTLTYRRAGAHFAAIASTSGTVNRGTWLNLFSVGKLEGRSACIRRVTDEMRNLPGGQLEHRR